MIDFEGYEYRPEKSDVTGGTWSRYGTTSVSMRIPMFNRQKVTHAVAVPQQYWIPPQWPMHRAPPGARHCFEKLEAPQIEYVAFRFRAPPGRRPPSKAIIR
jgi:hypothetical protein